MPLSPGTRFGPYEISAGIGAGGMGEVFRARDTKLNRDVAIKVLPAAFAQDAERVARFRREAQLLASLNHPNIAAIHGLEESDGNVALALELVEGEDLSARIARGPMPIAEALPIARQISEALEAAHEKSIVHRDLKPANVKLTPEGKVKVLDFGLAKAYAGEAAAGSAADLSHSPTLARTGTQAGLILGTASYMSPEQARGQRMDKRTDIWAFGALLFELLTGEKAFAGETVTDVLAAVVHMEPAWDRLPTEAPATIRRLLRRCLAKSADQRLHDIADARLEIDEALRARGDGSEDLSRPGEREATAKSGLRRRLALAALATATGLAGVASGVAWSRRAAPDAAEPVRRLSITGLGWSDAEMIDVTLAQNLMALSPDGSRLVYSTVRDGTRRLYLRELDAFDALPIKGTENGFGPFLSPDGASLAFTADGRLKKLSLAGGLPQTFGSAPGFRGGAWRADGTVFFTPLEFSGLWTASVAGGNAESLEPPHAAAGELVLCLPKLLPGGKSLLFTAFLGGKAARVGLYETATDKSKILLEDANNAHYLRSGHLVFGRGNEIWAAAFDPARSEIVGSPQKMIEGVWAGGFFHSTLFSASENGVLAYAPAGAQSEGRSLSWVDRDGRETPITREQRAYATPRLSPDGKSILVRIAEDTTDIWSYEIERGALTRLTSDGYEDGPLWTADGKAFIYPSNKSGVQALYRQPVAGNGEAVRMGPGGRTEFPETLSKDGKTIVVTEMNPRTGLDLFLIPLDADARRTPLLVTDSSEYAADLSPDGKWFVYVARASGRPEINVRSVAGGGDESRVSLDGGTEPRWSRGGGDIFYREGQKMMVAEVRTEPALQISKPRALFEGLYEVMDGPINYDVTPDGRRFLMVKMQRSQAPTELRVVTGWDRELRKALPAGR